MTRLEWLLTGIFQEQTNHDSCAINCATLRRAVTVGPEPRVIMSTTMRTALLTEAIANFESTAGRDRN